MINKKATEPALKKRAGSVVFCRVRYVSVKKQRSALRAQGLVRTLRSVGYPDDR